MFIWLNVYELRAGVCYSDSLCRIIFVHNLFQKVQHPRLVYSKTLKKFHMYLDSGTRVFIISLQTLERMLTFSKFLGYEAASRGSISIFNDRFQTFPLQISTMTLLQLCRLEMAPLLNRYYWNDVTLTGQNLPLKFS